MSDNSFPFRRMTDPIVLPVGTSSQTTQVPDGFIPKGATSFRAVNPNNFYVRLKGFDATGAAIGPVEGWLFPPNYVGDHTTQYPVAMSTIAYSAPGLPAGTGTLEVSYGGGGSGIGSGFALPPVPQQVADNGGSLTVDSPQLPASMGQKASAASSPVVLASDQGPLTTIPRVAANIATGQQAVAQAATLVLPARATRQAAVMAPAAAGAYYVGGSNVSPTTGVLIPSGGFYTHRAQTALYVYMASGTVTMTWLDEFN